jgi:ElaB/YqjD/DUF883 family membrane-anchored ribosome-binding protein
MDQERSEVREVEDARERVAEDVRNVAYNANVVDRAKENAQERMDDARQMMSERVRGARERLESARDSMRDMARNMPINPGENPMGMLLAGLAIGFLIGMLLPVTRFESERLGPVTDDVKERMRQAGSEVMRRGGEVIKETIETARETATNSIREQTRDMGMGGGGSQTY